jgi:hypothetical protein
MPKHQIDEMPHWSEGLELGGSVQNPNTEDIAIYQFQ